MEKNVIISHKDKLESAIKAISEAGAEGLHVISDFDRTLTKSFFNGEKISSVISILRNGEYLTKDYAEKAHALFKKYRPIETNAKIPLREKKKAMHDWWSKHFELLIKSNLHRKDIERIIKSEKIKFREGALEFIDLLHEYKIPLVIMSSSGLGEESISLYLDKHKRLYSNIYIISNSFIWDKKGYASGIKEPIIHVMNKDETSVKGTKAYGRIKTRTNVILLGDNPEDAGMIEGFGYHHLIKIGFLNKEVKKNLKRYRKNYDVLILNDSSMDYVNKLLKEIIYQINPKAGS